MKRRERRARERESRRKQNEERIRKLKAKIKEEELTRRREFREKLRIEMAKEKNMKIISGELTGSDAMSSSQMTMSRLMTDELSDKDYFKPWELQTQVYRKYLADKATKKAAEAARKATEKE